MYNLVVQFGCTICVYNLAVQFECTVYNLAVQFECTILYNFSVPLYNLGVQLYNFSVQLYNLGVQLYNWGVLYCEFCHLFDLGGVNLGSTPLILRKNYIRNNSLLLWAWGPGGQEEDIWFRLVHWFGTLVLVQCWYGGTDSGKIWVQ